MSTPRTRFRAALLRAALAIMASTIVTACAAGPASNSSKQVDSGSVSRDRDIEPLEVVPGGTVAYLDAGDLWLAGLDGSSPPLRLTRAKGAVSRIAWSGDAQRRAYVQERPGRCCDSEEEVEYVCCPDLRVLDFGVGRDRVVERDVIRLEEMHFAPDGELEWSSSREQDEPLAAIASREAGPSSNPMRSPNRRYTVTVVASASAKPPRVLLETADDPGEAVAIGALAGGGIGSSDEEFTELRPV